MKTKCFNKLLIGLCLLLGLASCKTQAPRLDYKAIAEASRRLDMDIGYTDNPKLYLESADWIGTPYRNGGNTKRGVDCSGFTKQVFSKTYGIDLQRTTQGQTKQIRKVSKGNLKEGDLVFFSSPRSRKRVAHVGIYLKDNLFVHASTSRGVIVSNLKSKYYRQHWLYGGRIKK